MKHFTFPVFALAVFTVSACSGAGEPSTPAPAPICKSSNTAPGCAPSTVAWSLTCDAPVPAPAVWCKLPEGGDTSGKVWCC